MKKMLLFFCLISNFAVFSQNTVMFSVNDCRKEASWVSNFLLYRNDALYGEYNSSIIDSLPDGNYYIEYDTYFGKRKSEPQYIDKNSFLPGFDVCVDEMPNEMRINTTNLLIDNLREGDELPIYRESFACFSGRRVDSLVIKKRNEKYFIIRNKKKRRLNHKQLNALRDFEIQMRNIKESNSYSTSWCNTYIGCDKDKISFGTPTGEWEGYEYLLIQLGLVKKRKSLVFREKYK